MAEVEEFRPHRVGFHGVIASGPLVLQPEDLLVTGDADIRQDGELLRIAYPPSDQAVSRVEEAIGRARPGRVVAVGDGFVLDVAKRALAQPALTPSQAKPVPTLTLVPVGAEPWRAFAPFTSLYGLDGARVSRRDGTVESTRIVIDGSLLRQRTESVRQLQRVDSATHAIEVLIGKAADSWGRSLALAALRALTQDDPVQDVTAAGLAAEAFSSSGLGLAHALASPIGADSRRTHDIPNAILGPHIVRYWGDLVDWGVIATTVGVAPSAEGVARWLDGLIVRAGLPQSLSEAGFDEGLLSAVPPRAVKSSGMPWLPQKIDERELSVVLRRAWAGT